MKKTYHYFLSLLLLIGLVPLKVKAEDYSNISSVELNQYFQEAVLRNDLREVQKLIDAGANVQTLIPYIETSGDCDWEVSNRAIIYGVIENRLDLVKILVKSETDLNEVLYLAIKEGHLPIVQELINEGANVCFVDKNGNTPLILSVMEARPYLEFSPDAQARYRGRWEQRRDIIQALLSSGAIASHANKEGKTALMYAVEKHDLYTVESLLQKPEMTTGSFFGFGTAPINYADKNGNTALITAIKCIRDSYITDQDYNMCVTTHKIVNLLADTPGIDFFHTNNQGEKAIELIDKHNESHSI